jgi:hypothetical protein
VVGAAPESGVTRIVRLRADGRPDPAFGGGDGIADVPTTTGIVDLAPLPHGGYLLVDNPGVGPTEGLPPLVAYRLGADGSVIDRTEIAVHIDPGSLQHTPPGFLDLWEIAVILVPTSDGVSMSVHLVAEGREGGFIGYGTTALVDFDAEGHLGAPWNTQGVTPPALRVGEGITDELLDVVALPDGRRLTTTSRTGPAGTTLSVTLPGAWTINPTSPFNGRPLARALTIVCGDHVLVAGETTNTDNVNQPLVAAYDLRTGALDHRFGTDGHTNVPTTLTTADTFHYLVGLVPQAPACHRFYTATTRFDGEGVAGGHMVTRVWSP